MIRLVPYQPSLDQAWQSLVERADNGHYFASRFFLAYHGDRFEDRSRLVYRGKRLIGVIPLHRSADGQRWCSHQGAPYAGFLQADNTHAEDISSALDLLAEELQADGAKALEFTPTPSFLHRRPCEEDSYLLLERGATLIRTRAAASLRIGAHRLSIKRRREFRELRKRGIKIRTDLPLRDAWEFASQTVHARMGRAPLHSVEDLELLNRLQPDSWRVHSAWLGDELLASKIYLRHRGLLRGQYIGYRDDRLGALGHVALYQNFLETPENQGLVLDIGTSNALDDGRLHLPIHYYKESYGARLSCIHTFLWTP